LGTANQISLIRKSRIPPERIRKRAEYEDKAKELLVAKISNLSWSLIDSVISLIDSDFWQGEEVEGRFFPLFCKPNRNRIKTNDLRNLKEFLTAIIEKENVARIDELISRLNGISYGAASLFFYVKDRNRYNVFLPVTVKGLKAVYPEKAKEVTYERPFAENYSLFNDLCNSLKKEFSVEPQELDILLTVLAKQKQVEIPEQKEPKDTGITEPIDICGHEEAEAILLELGNLLGYETYTADPAKSYKNAKLGEIASSKDVPQILRNTKNVQRIDVIWYKEEMPPSYFFDVDGRRTMRDAIHRLYQARNLNVRFFIIGPKEVREKFEEWVSTAPYNSSRNLYNFRTFEELSRLYGLIKGAESSKKEFGIM